MEDAPDSPFLTATEARVLGSLLEKELTTPEYYPLTLQSLTAACNQRSNRDPIVAWDEATVSAAAASPSWSSSPGAASPNTATPSTKSMAVSILP